MERNICILKAPEGRLYAPDAYLEALPNTYYPIIEIHRIENGNVREYKINGSIQIIDGRIYLMSSD